MTERPVQMKVAMAFSDAMVEHLGPAANGTIWPLLSDDELYALEYWFFGHHGDIVNEWSRRQMRAADPVR